MLETNITLDNNRLPIHTEADRIFAQVGKDLIVLIDRPTHKGAHQEDEELFVLPAIQDDSLLEEVYKELVANPVLPELDSAPQRVRLNDWGVYMVSLSLQWHVTVEGNNKKYSLQFAKPKLKLPLYASLAKAIMSHESFNKEVDKMLIKKGIDDLFVRTCILEGMSLHNVIDIDIDSGTIVWRSPENTDHKIAMWRAVLLSIINEVVIQAKRSAKIWTSTVLLDPANFSTMIDYIDETYKDYDIKWAIAQYLDGVSIQVVIK